MAMLYTGFDVFFWPMRLGSPLDEGTSRLRMSGDIDGTTDVHFDDGLYTTIGNAHDEVESLFGYLSSGFTAELGTTTFERSLFPDGHGSFLVGWGLKITCAQPFEINTNDGASKACLEILGFEPGAGVISSTPSGGNHVIDSPKPHGLVWRTPKHSQEKLSNRIHEQHASGGRGQTVQLTRWGTDQVRLFKYIEIPAAHVRAGRADLGAFASVGRLPAGATTNAFVDFWLGGISSYMPVFAGYNLTEFQLLGLVDFDAIDDREILSSPQGSGYADELDSCISRSRRSAEHYAVEFALRVDESWWGQG